MEFQSNFSHLDAHLIDIGNARQKINKIKKKNNKIPHKLKKWR